MVPSCLLPRRLTPACFLFQPSRPPLSASHEASAQLWPEGWTAAGHWPASGLPTCRQVLGQLLEGEWAVGLAPRVAGGSWAPPVGPGDGRRARLGLCVAGTTRCLR